MPWRKLPIVLLLTLHRSRWLQVGLLAAFWVIGDEVSRFLALPVPGGIVGMLIVLALLCSRRISPFSMRRGAYWLLAEMLLFFVPATMGIIDHREFLSALGLKLVAVIVVGTLTVMAGTATTIEVFYRWRMRHAET